MSKNNNFITILLSIIVITLSSIIIYDKIIMKKQEEKPTINIKQEETSTSTKQKTSVDTKQIITYYKNIISGYDNPDYLYSVIDINNDNIPELFVFTTGNIKNERIAYTNIYTYDENKGEKSNNYIVSCGTLIGRIDNSVVLYKTNNGRLLYFYNKMGTKYGEYYKLENDWLIRTKTDLNITENTITNSTEIDFKSINDSSIINNYQ